MQWIRDHDTDAQLLSFTTQPKAVKACTHPVTAWAAWLCRRSDLIQLV